jgi:sodium-dependent dicarboxylate transporter 2/3/5
MKSKKRQIIPTGLICKTKVLVGQPKSKEVNFMSTSRRILLALMGPIIYLLVSICGASALTVKGAQAVGVSLWMVFWWVTRPVDITTTAFVPVACNALFNIVPMGALVSQYSNPSIILVFSSTLLTLPWAKIGLDRRVALKCLSVIGPSMKSQIIVWSVFPILFSTVLPNVVVVALFTPIAIAMLKAAGYDGKSAAAAPILCAIGWCAGIGGVGTPVGGAMNVVAIDLLQKTTGHEFLFMDWVSHIVPYLIITSIICIIGQLMLPREVENLEGTKEYFTEAYKELGPMKRTEKISMSLFVIALVGSFLRPLYAAILPGLVPAFLYAILGFLGFFINGDDGKPLVDWDYVQKNMLWGMMILFAGGLAMGNLLGASGANKAIAELIANNMHMGPGLPMIIAITIFAVAVSEATNSTVSAAVVVPIVITYTQKAGLPLIPYFFVTAMAYNSEFLLPVSVRAITCGNGLDPNVQMKRGIPIMLLRALCVIVVGYICLQIPGFAQVGSI